MSKDKKAVIFIRARHVGDNVREAEEWQIAAQRRICQETAQQLGVAVTGEYIEHGGTGSLERRPILRQMYAELLQRRDVAYVITTSVDRLARRTADLASIQLDIQAAGAELVLASDPANPMLGTATQQALTAMRHEGSGEPTNRMEVSK